MNKYITEEDIDVLAEGVIDCLIKEAGVLSAAGRLLQNIGTSGIGRIYKGNVGRGLVTGGTKLRNIEESYMTGLRKAQTKDSALTGQLIEGVKSVAKDHPGFTGVSATLTALLGYDKFLKKPDVRKVPYETYRYASALNKDNMEIFSEDLAKEATGTVSLVGQLVGELAEYESNKQNFPQEQGNFAEKNRKYRQMLIDKIEGIGNISDNDFKVIEEKLGERRRDLLGGIDLEKLSYRVGGYGNRQNYGYQDPTDSKYTIPALVAGTGALAGALLAKRRLDSKVLKNTEGVRNLGAEIQSFSKKVDDLVKKHDTPKDVVDSFNSITHELTRKETVQRFDDIKAEIKSLSEKMRKVKDTSELPDIDIVFKSIDNSVRRKDIPDVAGNYLKDYANQVFKFKS